MSTVQLPADLQDALSERLHATAPSRASAQVERLIENYRGTTPTAAPILRDAADAAAYAAYRMPATYAAVRSALGAFRAQAGDWAPGTHLDLGGGTGAATWAVADAWPGGTHRSTVLDWSQPALTLGRELARGAGEPAVRAAEWTRAPLGGAPALPAADLVTVSYVIGELTPAGRAALLDAAAAATRGALVVAEPGTPDGYRRIIEARDRLVAAGLTVLAPCPHDGTCPITGTDWCHFAARVPRTSLHRQVKGGTLPYEDEKFGYVAAARPDAVPGAPAAARVVRHPQIRKGQVLLDLCTRDDGLTRNTVTKRHGPAYRAARDTEWGDTWPPAPDADADAAADSAPEEE
ncbi:small ribosomal subunit Rsm22 family protein [Actinacidiphila rubida]|uniref:small ribosomal subunit Rsm22 family protein n=1 Tax=Actinacidiphila rubida TaxID=310780 RepID=UPI00099FC26F|nr:small ribosomal subunit Rsm22 family protein [Actinacidiphila rubida]